MLGYHLTAKTKGKLSPIVIFVLREWLLTLYAVAASMVPGLVVFGAACTSRLRWLPTCKCESCNVPASATTKGVYDEDWEPSAPSCVALSETRYWFARTEGGSGFEGMRQERGASL